MSRISDRITELTAALPKGVRLVAVSKFHPVESVKEAYNVGQRRFGESRADELAAKAAAMPADVEWHFIGHLQTNKVRKVVAVASVIESIDSERLLRLVDSEARRIDKHIDVLLQVHVAAEESKTGMTPDELLAAARSTAGNLTHARIAGVMGMATNTDDSNRIRADFRAIAQTAARLRDLIPAATEISMGMSGDRQIAVDEGSTMVRIGSDIFGPRPAKV